jgi:hypothetical protein
MEILLAELTNIQPKNTNLPTLQKMAEMLSNVLHAFLPKFTFMN